MKIAFLSYADSSTSASYRRSLGFCKLIDYSLDTSCELISVGALYNNQHLSENKIIRFFQKCVLEAKHYFRVKTVVKSGQYDAIFSVFIGIRTMNWLKKYCHKNSIKLFGDFCEWCIPETFKLGRLSPGYRKNHYAMTKWVNQTSNVTGISRCIVNHFVDLKAKTMRIPNLTDYDNAPTDSYNSNKKLELFFVGNKSKRDNCDKVIDALGLLNEEERKKIHVTFTACVFFGSHNANTNKELFDSLLNEGVITVYSYLPLEDYEKRLQASDFSIFYFCSNDRNANAGFPTRLMDATYLSVPVISNIANDLELFLKDGKNSIVANGYSPKDIADSFKKALVLNDEQKKLMRRASFETGKSNFDFRVYKDEFIKFFNEATI